MVPNHQGVQKQMIGVLSNSILFMTDRWDHLNLLSEHL